MDVLQIIEAGHNELRAQLSALAETAIVDPEESVYLFYLFRQNLSDHHQAEEQLLFSRLIGFDDARQVIGSAWEQHAAIELYVQRMHRSHKMVRWAAKAALLNQLAEQHWAMEEESVFEMVRDRLGGELDALGVSFEEHHQKLPALVPL